MNKNARLHREMEATWMMRETEGMHAKRWKRLGEKRICELNEWQHPKVLAVGPRVVGGLKGRYLNDSSYDGKPGKVFEVTTMNDGSFDRIGAGSVLYAVKHLGVSKVDVWGNGKETQKKTVASLEEIFGGKHALEIREHSAHGDQIYNVGEANAVVLSCSDSRVQVHDIYDYAFVVSNAGNILSPAAIEVIGEMVEKGVPIVMVLGHSKCGAVGAALKGMDEPALLGTISTIRHNIRGEKPEDAEVKNAVASAELLKSNGFAEYCGQELQKLQNAIREAGTSVVARFFELSTGEVREI